MSDEAMVRYNIYDREVMESFDRILAEKENIASSFDKLQAENKRLSKRLTLAEETVAIIGGERDVLRMKVEAQDKRIEEALVQLGEERRYFGSSSFVDEATAILRGETK